MSGKLCVCCGETKQLHEFGSDGKLRKNGCTGHKPRCKSCDNQMSYEYTAKNMEARRAMVRKWKKANPEKINESNFRYRKNNRFNTALNVSRGSAGRHGHIPCTATVDEISESFTGHCHVCGVPESECERKLCLDHDHETGAFRGWLCMGCNVAIGFLRDSEEIILSLAEYVKKSKSVTY